MTKDRITPTKTDFLLRPAGWDDLQPVARLIYDVCEAEGDTSFAVTPEQLANDWKQDGFQPGQDAVVVVAPSGQVVGYGELQDVREHYHLSGDLYVHPNYVHQGVHASLVQAMEIRGREHVQLADPARRVFIRIAASNRDEPSKASFTRQGYSPIRYYWRMEINLEADPPAPHLPAGFDIRPFVWEEHARAVWQARNEAFQSHWGSHPISFEKFTHYYYEAPEFEPDLWSMIWDREELAGFSINHYRIGLGWIRTLGVRPAWRARGLGLALLQHAFSEFHRRGMHTIGLSVDAANPTGATRLYHKSGMRVESEYVMFEKELRPGFSDPEPASDS